MHFVVIKRALDDERKWQSMRNRARERVEDLLK